MRIRKGKRARSLKCIGLVIIALNIIIISWNMTSITINKSVISNQESVRLKPNLGNQELIEQLLDAKIEEFRREGFFSEYYYPSIHATYYAVQSLMYLGKEDVIDKYEIVNFLMDHYDDSSHTFRDEYSDRYLDSDFIGIYYPLTSILEVNCYATLTLDLLGNLSLIDKQETIDFIWSCYNPIDHGFIGRPYDSSLTSGFRTSTAENTYFAVIALDVLLSDWSAYEDEVDEIILFINTLHGSNGCFKNDQASSIYTVCPSDKSIISSYYCIKILEKFGSVATMGLSDFWEYMEATYQATENFFSMREFIGLEEEMNLVASAMAIELADLTWFSGYDRSATIQYVLDHRNTLGNWNDGTIGNNHDLWFTYTILRSLYNTGSLSTLSSEDINQIASSFDLYKNPIAGYSLISRDYTSIKSINSIIKSLKLEGKYNDLAILEKEAIFNQIVDACVLNYFPESSFTTQINMALESKNFRTFPIESNSYGNREIFQEIGMPHSHKAMYFALEVFEKTFKLDDLNDSYSLLGFVQSIVDCQFLEPGYDGNGGFLPNKELIYVPAENRDNNVFLEYSYYAIKSLRLLSNFLELGPISELGIDCDSLTEFIYRNILEDSTQAYYQPRYTGDSIDGLKNTYFALELLKMLETYLLDDEKIITFALQNLDYSNIASVYYCFKILDLIGEEYSFNCSLTKNLVQQLYYEGINGFYLSTKKTKIEPEALSWICEMANSEWICGESQCESLVALGTTLNVSASLNGLIYDVDSTDYTAVFESEHLGSFSLLPSRNSFWQEIMVPISSENYPLINGKIKISVGGAIILNIPVTFVTFCESKESFNAELVYDGSVQFTASSQIIIGSECVPSGPHGYEVYVDVYLDDDFVECIYLNRTELEDENRTNYCLNYVPSRYGDYYYEMFYEHPFQDNPELVFTWSCPYTGPAAAFKEQEDNLILASTLSMGFFIAPFIIGGVYIKVKGDLRKRFPDKTKKSFKFKKS